MVPPSHQDTGSLHLVAEPTLQDTGAVAGDRAKARRPASHGPLPSGIQVSFQPAPAAGTALAPLPASRQGSPVDVRFSTHHRPAANPNLRFMEWMVEWRAGRTALPGAALSLLAGTEAGRVDARGTTLRTGTPMGWGAGALWSGLSGEFATLRSGDFVSSWNGPASGLNPQDGPDSPRPGRKPRL